MAAILYAPLFTFSLRRHRFTTSSVSTIITKKTKASFPTFKNTNSTPKTRFLPFSCYCSTTEEQTNINQPKVENEDSKIKDAVNTLDIRVGKILKAWRHEEADSLYVEEVDVGESEPRIICSGLVNYIPIDLMQDRNVIVLANLKARNMRGVKSNGMLMAASDASHEKVELLSPPQGALPGDRVWFGSVDERDNLPDVASPNQVQKKKIWELVQPHLKTDESFAASLGPHPMRTLSGVVTCVSLKNANIS